MRLVLSSAVVLLFAGTLLAKTVVDAGRLEGIEPPRHYMPLLSFGATIAMCLVGAAFALSVFGHATWWTGLLAVVAALVISPAIATCRRECRGATTATVGSRPPIGESSSSSSS